jgi:hypothetical protein
MIHDATAIFRPLPACRLHTGIAEAKALLGRTSLQRVFHEAAIHHQAIGGESNPPISPDDAYENGAFLKACTRA